MSIRERLTLAAAMAVALAASALGPVYADLGWLARVLGAVATVGALGLLMRRLSVPVVLQPTLQLLGLAWYAAVVFARDTLAFGVLPVQATVRRIVDLAETGLADVEQLAPPVPTSTGLVLLAVLGVGGIAVLVDVVTVVLGRAAIAGLPLLLLFAVPSAVLTDGLGWLPFTLTASGWLALLLVEGSDRVGRWGTPLRSSTPTGYDDDSSLGRVGRRIGAAALGMAIVIPAVLPGLDTRLLDGGSGSGIGGSGEGRSSTTYNPITALEGFLNLPEPRPLFSYTTNDPGPDYIRMTTLDLYRDGQWSASELRGDPDDDAVDDGIPRPVGLGGVPTREFGMRMRISGLRTQWLPAPATPIDVDVPGRWVWDKEAETVFSAQQDTADLRDDTFDLRAVRALPPPDSLTTVGAVPAEIDPYREEIALTPKVTAELDRIVAGRDTDFARVLALQDYLRSSPFSYDTRAAAAPAGKDPLEFFLGNRKGFCEQYASAMAALVRALGLPARVAVGFTPGTATSGTYLVTTSEAHAWPEVWFEGAGWVRFEPTPRTGVTTLPAYAAPDGAAPGVTPSGGAQPTAEPTASAGASGAPNDPRLREDFEQETGALADPAGGRDGDGRSLPPLPVALVALAALALALPALLSVLRRRHRSRLPGPLIAWAQVHDDAGDVGHVWRPADSPRSAARRLAADRDLPPAAVEALARLAAATERVRFAPPGSTSLETDHATDVATVRSALLDTAAAATRWRARLLPPSTVRWGSHVIGERIADLLDAVDNVVAAVTHRLRLRPRPG